MSSGGVGHAAEWQEQATAGGPHRAGRAKTVRAGLPRQTCAAVGTGRGGGGGSDSWIRTTACARLTKLQSRAKPVALASTPDLHISPQTTTKTFRRRNPAPVARTAATRTGLAPLTTAKWSFRVATPHIWSECAHKLASCAGWRSLHHLTPVTGPGRWASQSHRLAADAAHTWIWMMRCMPPARLKQILRHVCVTWHCQSVLHSLLQRNPATCQCETASMWQFGAWPRDIGLFLAGFRHLPCRSGVMCG